jgi:hypothetical protein
MSILKWKQHETAISIVYETTENWRYSEMKVKRTGKYDQQTWTITKIGG